MNGDAPTPPEAAADPRAVLGVAADASMAEARDAYRRRMRLLHPDLHRDAPEEVRAEAARAAAEVNAAWDALRRGTPGPGPAAGHRPPPPPYPPGGDPADAADPAAGLAERAAAQLRANAASWGQWHARTRGRSSRWRASGRARDVADRASELAASHASRVAALGLDDDDAVALVTAEALADVAAEAALRRRDLRTPSQLLDDADTGLAFAAYDVAAHTLDERARVHLTRPCGASALAHATASHPDADDDPQTTDDPSATSDEEVSSGQGNAPDGYGADEGAAATSTGSPDNGSHTTDGGEPSPPARAATPAPRTDAGPPATAAPGRSSGDEGLAIAAHLSALVALLGVPPVLGPVLALVVARDDGIARDHARAATDFHLTWTAATVVAAVALVGAAAAFPVSPRGSAATAGILLVATLAAATVATVAWLIGVLRGSRAASRGELSPTYPLTVPLLRSRRRRR